MARREYHSGGHHEGPGGNARQGIEGVILYDVVDVTLRGGSTKMVPADKGYKVAQTKDFPVPTPRHPGPAHADVDAAFPEMYRFAAREAGRIG